LLGLSLEFVWLLISCGLLMLVTGIALSSLGQSGRERAPACFIPVGHLLGAVSCFMLLGVAIHERFAWQIQIVLQALAAVAYLRAVGGRVGWFPKGVFAQRWRWALQVWFAALPGLYGVTRINNFLFEHVFAGQPGNQVVTRLAAMTPQELLLTLPVIVLLMPALEEALFRGYLFRMLVATSTTNTQLSGRAYSTGKRHFSTLGALLTSASVFALAHGSGMWLPALYLGSLLAWIDWRGGDLRLNILVHCFHNAVFLAVA
jgi:membrane protease YdiL (CAAX protease family)